MWTELICGLFIYRIVKRLFYGDEAHDLDLSRFDALFAVAKRLQKLYKGSNVYVGLQIPDFDSATRKDIDLVLVTNKEALVISVKNLSGIVSIDKDNNWVCADTKSHKTERLPNPVDETKELVSILEQYLDQRGVALPKGYLSYKVICPNPKFGFIHPDLSPPEVITQLTQLKPEQRNLYTEWIKGALLGGKEKTQESFSEQLNFVLSTAPISDRLELEGNKCILGKFLEFKGAQDNIHLLRKIKRSKVSRVTVQKTSLFGYEVRVLSTPREYLGAGSSSSSQREEVIVKSYSEVDETRELVSILEHYLDQRGVVLPKGYLSYKVICPNPGFGLPRKKNGGEKKRSLEEIRKFGLMENKNMFDLHDLKEVNAQLFKENSAKKSLLSGWSTDDNKPHIRFQRRWAVDPVSLN